MADSGTTGPDGITGGKQVDIGGGIMIGLPTNQPWYMMFKEVRYILNMVFVAIPYSIIGILLITYNLILNIWLNEGWAGANAWLIGNTVFLVIQWVISLMIFWEIELWIFYCKFLRFASLLLGVIYFALYIVAVFFLLDILGDWEQQ